MSDAIAPENALLAFIETAPLVAFANREATVDLWGVLLTSASGTWGSQAQRSPAALSRLQAALTNGADIDFCVGKPQFHATALSVAVEAAWPEAVEALLNAGAPVLYPERELDDERRTGAEFVAYEGPIPDALPAAARQVANRADGVDWEPALESLTLVLARTGARGLHEPDPTLFRSAWAVLVEELEEQSSPDLLARLASLVWAHMPHDLVQASLANDDPWPGLAGSALERDWRQQQSLALSGQLETALPADTPLARRPRV